MSKKARVLPISGPRTHTSVHRRMVEYQEPAIEDERKRRIDKAARKERDRVAQYKKRR